MIRLSENILTSALKLLEYLETYSFLSMSELTYSKIVSISAEDVFSFSCGCGWSFENENSPVLTERGAELLQLQTEKKLLELVRKMLADYVLKAKPTWAYRIPFGRCEAAIYMSKDEKACFKEAGLLSDHPDHGIVEWWDTIASQIRRQDQKEKNETGRSGEENSIIYERARTNSEPVWMSSESNLAGYDIMSITSKDSSDKLLIEVKTTKCELNEAEFHISSNEWQIALTSTSYVFHLWCLYGNKKMLAVITPDEVKPSIPTNNFDGEWENVKIPFSCFKSKFMEIC